MVGWFNFILVFDTMFTAFLGRFMCNIEPRLSFGLMWSFAEKLYSQCYEVLCITVQLLLLTNSMQYFTWTVVVHWILTFNSLSLFVDILSMLFKEIFISNVLLHTKQIAVCNFSIFCVFPYIIP